MEFRDLKTQYFKNKKEIDLSIEDVLKAANYIGGSQVIDLEEKLAEYVGVKHCISCANGTDALLLALMAFGVKKGDAVFVPDFTFFSTAEVVPWVQATPIFVDVDKDTFNMSADSLEEAIQNVTKEGKLIPKVVIAVDLFGQPANYLEILKIVKKYKLFLLEDGAQGFGGKIGERRACSFGDISTTSFFPAKPLGCYGDGGAVFTDNDEWALLIRSYCIHGKGTDKYNNVRIGMNSRLDTLQAAILQIKLKVFEEYELMAVNKVADHYTEKLGNMVETPKIGENFLSSWAQYSILLKNEMERDGLQAYLKEKRIPTMVYYPKPLSRQGAFKELDCVKVDLSVTEDLCRRVLALPMHPYMTEEEQDEVIRGIRAYVGI